jgi:hypothetical protein
MFKLSVWNLIQYLIKRGICLKLIISHFFILRFMDKDKILEICLTLTCDFFCLGCSEMLMANAVMDEAVLTPGKEARAMESFAHALRQLPTIIAENGGYDSAQLVSELRAVHKEGRNTMGLGN